MTKSDRIVTRRPAYRGGAVGKDTLSRVWRKVKSDWDAWNARALAKEPVVRRILDGTVVRVRLDRPEKTRIRAPAGGNSNDALH